MAVVFRHNKTPKVFCTMNGWGPQPLFVLILNQPKTFDRFNHKVIGALL